MSYPKKLLRLRPTRGFESDTPAHEVGPEFYTAASNVIFREGFPKRVPGSRQAYTTALATAAPGNLVHGINADLAGTNYWLVFEDDGTAWAIEGTNATQIDAALLSAVTDPHRHNSALLNGVPIYNNGSDEPTYWNGTNLVTLTDWTASESCKFIGVFKYHIFAMNFSTAGGLFPSLVRWSSAAEPGTIPNSWTPSASNEAGSAELADSPGGMVCGYPLRDSFMLYKRSATYAASYVGGNQVFRIRKVQSSHGALTRRSVADIGGTHLVVSDGDIWLTDGTNRKSIGEARVKDYLFNNIDSDSYENLFAVYNRAKDEVLIGFPFSGSTLCNTALVYDVSRDAWGVRDLPDTAHAAIGYVNDATPSNTWADRTDTWAEAVDTWGSSTLASATDSLVLFEIDEMLLQDQNDAVVVAANFGKHDMTFGEPERVKFVKRVHVRAEPNYGTLFVRVGGKMRPNDPTTWSNEVSITDPEQVVNCFAMGRYISIEIRSAGSTVWTVTGIDIEAELRGYF